METIALDPERPSSDALERAATVLTQGGLVAFPTETFYGLGADAREERALAALHAAKGRKPDAPILLLIDEPESAAAVAEELTASFEILGHTFWPGPLTLVLRARPGLSESLTAGTGTIGVRVPGAAIARGLVRALGRPVTGTSANLSGAPPPRTAAEVRDALGESLDLLLDGGLSPGGAPSTVVDLSLGEPRLIRAGAIAFERVLAALSGR